jgi:predicted glycosyltransferase
VEHKQIHVLVTPLDWGLGHATRCIPIIRALLERGCRVSIASSGQPLQLLKEEFPKLIFFELASYQPRYVATGSLIRSLLAQIPKFINAIWNEKRQVKNLIREYKINAIISDNRYGCYNPSVKSIFVTHQLSILLSSRFGWLAGIANQMNQWMISRFDQCWIPDLPDHMLSGDLSKPLNEKCRMVGVLSRFEKKEVQEKEKKKWKVLAVVSGPEPQRSLFETILREQLIPLNEPSLLVKGLPGDSSISPTSDNLHEVNYLNASRLQAALLSAEFVVCRSGYSSVMDLAMVGQQNCIMVPTPGQPEQEYLADKLNAERIVFSVAQNDFNLNMAMQSVISRKGFTLPASQPLLQVAVDDLLNAIHHG